MSLHVGVGVGEASRREASRREASRRDVHITAKIASHTLRLLLRLRFGINVLTFQSQPI
ncbi:MAG: hypothetical protein RMX96_03995 [Nostoc sp. ChiSLP02]|nr:hypothetical protein [Nostoc sp. ChiSLP02]